MEGSRPHPDSRRRIADLTDLAHTPAGPDRPHQYHDARTVDAPRPEAQCEHGHRPRVVVRSPAENGFSLEVIYACERCIERHHSPRPRHEVRDRSGRSWPVISRKTPRDLVDDRGTGWTVELARGDGGPVLRFTSAAQTLTVPVADERHPHARSRGELLACLRHRNRRAVAGHRREPLRHAPSLRSRRFPMPDRPRPSAEPPNSVPLHL